MKRICRTPAAALAALAAVVALAAAPASALDLPKRKSGLWEIETMRDGRAPPGPPGSGTIRMCIDEKTDDLSRQMGESATKEHCSKNEMRREGEKFVAESVCRFGETTATSHSVLTGKFDSAYEVDVRTTFAPPMMGMAESHSVIKARWTGPCAAGMRPGDVIMPGGMKMNMFDAGKAAPKQP